MKTNRILTLALFLLLTPPVSRAALFDAILIIDGINGESTDPARRGDLQVLSYSFGATQTGIASTPTPTATGRVNVHDIVVTKHVDKTSAKLLEACASGKHFNHAVLTVSRGNGKGSVEIIKISMEDVIISSYQTGGDSGNSLPTDRLSLNFGKVKVDYAEGSVELSVGDAPES